MKKFLILIFIATKANAWTLTNSGLSGFQTSSEVDVYITGNTCANINLTSAQMQTLVTDAINTFWNSVSSSSLKLNFKNATSYDSSNSDLNDVLNDAATNNQIHVGCSSNATLFTSGTTLAVGAMSCISNTDCRGGVLLNDTAATQLNSVSNDVFKSVFAHELGHALGIGHSSVPESLMYYSASNKVQKKLNQDDVDAVTYLYPNEKKVAGLAGACGTIKSQSDHSNQNFILSLIFGVLILKLLKMRFKDLFKSQRNF